MKDPHAQTACGAPTAGIARRASLAADVDFAEAQDDVAVRCGAAEAEFRAEAREHHDLIELAAHGIIIDAGKNPVAHGFAILVHRGFHQQRMSPAACIVTEAGDREWRERFDARRLKQIRRRIVHHSAERNTDAQNLDDHSENEQRGHETAGDRQCERLENIFQDEFGTIAPPAQVAGEPGFLARFGNGDTNANREIRRRRNVFHARHQREQFLIALQLPAAVVAFRKVLIDFSMLGRRAPIPAAHRPNNQAENSESHRTSSHTSLRRIPLRFPTPTRRSNVGRILSAATVECEGSHRFMSQANRGAAKGFRSSIFVFHFAIC